MVARVEHCERSLPLLHFPDNRSEHPAENPYSKEGPAAKTDTGTHCIPQQRKIEDGPVKRNDKTGADLSPVLCNNTLCET